MEGLNHSVITLLALINPVICGVKLLQQTAGSARPSATASSRPGPILGYRQHDYGEQNRTLESLERGPRWEMEAL